MSDDLEQLRKLASEAIEIRKRIKADTDKLQGIKNQVVEKSKSRNSSYTIKVDDGSIRIIKYKRTIYYQLNQKGFDKLDNQTKNNLLKDKLVKIKFSVNPDKYKEFTRLLINRDLRAVVAESDYLICLWDESVLKGGGTHGEVTIAYFIGKPVYLVNHLPMRDFSGWIFSCATETFNSFDALKKELLKRYK